eukprot:GHVU01167067.1.p2 GENE.GHVU01167067.1~~GHVU01167067.1.p2  ORF type:complete len:121 (+),score=1.95 GHVU01167067.1:152-514(+)
MRPPNSASTPSSAATATAAPMRGEGGLLGPGALLDAHCHLQRSPFSPRRLDRVLRRASRVGVKVFAVNSVTGTDWGDVLRLYCQYPNRIIPNFGVHPWYVRGWMCAYVPTHTYIYIHVHI